MTSPQRGDSFTHPHGRQRFFALVPCAGTGSRSGAAGPKQYEELAGRALVLWTLEALARVGELDGTLYGHVLLPGQPVAVDGPGEWLGGIYYVDRVSHRFNTEGYRQQIRLLRNAYGDNLGGGFGGGPLAGLL